MTSATPRSWPAAPTRRRLHWWRNNGPTQTGQLLLADMGVETDELYTADVTRTLPIDGRYTPDQLRIYRAVYEAQTAGIAEVKAGADFLAAHRAAMWVLADHLHSWGILPVTADVSCADDPERPGAGLHRRYTLHATSHMLGIDVHDCALARREVSTRGTLAKGHVLTVEPGLYFQVNDRTVPPRAAGHRGADRGRHRRHRRGTDEPFGVTPPPPGGGHRLDGRRAEDRRPGRDAPHLAELDAAWACPAVPARRERRPGGGWQDGGRELWQSHCRGRQGPCEIAQRFRGVAITPPGVDPTAAQQSVGLRDTP